MAEQEGTTPAGGTDSGTTLTDEQFASMAKERGYLPPTERDHIAAAARRSAMTDLQKNPTKFGFVALPKSDDDDGDDGDETASKKAQTVVDRKAQRRLDKLEQTANDSIQRARRSEAFATLSEAGLRPEMRETVKTLLAAPGIIPDDLEFDDDESAKEWVEGFSKKHASLFGRKKVSGGRAGSTSSVDSSSSSQRIDGFIRRSFGFGQE